MSIELQGKAFQYNVINDALYTNIKLYKIGYTTDGGCSFCKTEPETLNHLLIYCKHTKKFGRTLNFARSADRSHKPHSPPDQLQQLRHEFQNEMDITLVPLI